MIYSDVSIGNDGPLAVVSRTTLNTEINTDSTTSVRPVHYSPSENPNEEERQQTITTDIQSNSDRRIFDYYEEF